MSSRRAPIGRIVDLAIAVPTCTLVAAKRAIPLVARVGTLGTARLVGRVSEAVHDLREDGTAPITVESSDSDAQVVDTDEADSAESVSSDELPIAGYDDLAARQVVARLSSLDRPDLARVEVYEREHRNRSTVLGKISMLTS